MFHTFVIARHKAISIAALLVMSGTIELSAEEQNIDVQLVLPPPTAEQQEASQRDAVVALRFSPSGRFLALGMTSGSLVVFDIKDGRLAWAREAHEKPTKLLSFSEDDRHLLTGADDLNVRHWDTVTGMMHQHFQGAPLRCLYDIKLSPDASFAAARGFDGFGVLWDLGGRKKVTDLFSYTVAFDPQGQFLVTAARRQPGAQLFRLDRSADPQQILPEKSINCLAVDPSGRQIGLAVLSWDGPGEIAIVASETGRVARQLRLPWNDPDAEIGVSELGFSRDGKLLLLGCTNGRVVCLDAETGESTGTYAFSDSITVGHVGFVGADDDYVVASGWGNDSDLQTRCWKFGGTDPLWTKAGTVTVDRKARLGARVTVEGDVELFLVSTGKRLMALRGYVRGTRWLQVEAK